MQELETEPLSLEHVMWASCVVASGTCLLLVCYTGGETRSAMNASHPPSKVGLLDNELNFLSKVRFALSVEWRIEDTGGSGRAPTGVYGGGGWDDAVAVCGDVPSGVAPGGVERSLWVLVHQPVSVYLIVFIDHPDLLASQFGHGENDVFGV